MYSMRVKDWSHQSVHLGLKHVTQSTCISMPNMIKTV